MAHTRDLAALKVALQRPELVANLSMHEPNLLAILGEECAPMLEQLKVHVGATMAELNQGNYEVAPPLFLNALCAPGTWDELPKSMRKTFVCGRSRPWAAAVVSRLGELVPHARRHTYPDAAHFPQITHPRELVEVVMGFLDSIAAYARCRTRSCNPL